MRKPLTGIKNILIQVRKPRHMVNDSVQDLEQQALKIRRSVLDMISASGSSHISPAFSIVDILTSLYFGILKIDAKNPGFPDRDRFVLSKGHAGSALYATLAHRGFFPLEKLSQFAKNGSSMAGHIVRGSVPGMETTAGSLGHGLAMGIGMALALKNHRSHPRVFVLVGDGECNEGSIWEGALAAVQFKLDNLVLIIDKNQQQSLGPTAEIMNMDPMAEKWKAFGWQTFDCAGHDFEKLRLCFTSKPVLQKPTVVVAHTVKGKGVTFMEKDPLVWHYKTPLEEFLVRAREELGGNA